MLKSLDAIIAFTAIMLMASMAVTVITEIYTVLRNTRGTHLRDGLNDLLKQIDPTFREAIVHEISSKILSHPLIRDSARRFGTLVHRDEFTRLLIELAAGSGPQSLTEEARLVLNRSLAANGIPDPKAALRLIRDLALEFEKSHPYVAAHIRQDMAILVGTGSDLVARINGSFDQTIDRIAGRFTLTTRQVSLAASLAVAFVLHLDAIAMLRNLIDPVPTQPLAHIPGIIFSTLLLSLGAPFWFETLKTLLRLRSTLAVEDDQQRTQRTTAVDK